MCVKIVAWTHSSCDRFAVNMNTVAASTLLSDEAELSAPSAGYRQFNDPLFAENNRNIFPPFVRLGVYSFDDENLWHKP